MNQPDSDRAQAVTAAPSLILTPGAEFAELWESWPGASQVSPASGPTGRIAGLGAAAVAPGAITARRSPGPDHHASDSDDGAGRFTAKEPVTYVSGVTSFTMIAVGAAAAVASLSAIIVETSPPPRLSTQRRGAARALCPGRRAQPPQVPLPLPSPATPRPY